MKNSIYKTVQLGYPTYAKISYKYKLSSQGLNRIKYLKKKIAEKHKTDVNLIKFSIKKLGQKIKNGQVIFLFIVTFTLNNYFLVDLPVTNKNENIQEICQLKGGDLPNPSSGSSSGGRFNPGNKARGRARHENAMRRKNNLPTCPSRSSVVDALLTPQTPFGPVSVENIRRGQREPINHGIGNNHKPPSPWGIDPKPTISGSSTKLELNSKSQEPYQIHDTPESAEPVLKHRDPGFETSNEPINNLHITTVSGDKRIVEVSMKASDVKRSMRFEDYEAYLTDDFRYAQNGKVSEIASHVQNPDSIHKKSYRGKDCDIYFYNKDKEPFATIVDRSNRKLVLDTPINSFEKNQLLDDTITEWNLDSDLRRDPQTGCMNKKSVNEAKIIKRAREIGVFDPDDELRRPRLWQGEQDTDVVKVMKNNSMSSDQESEPNPLLKKYEIKSIGEYSNKTSQSSAKDVASKIRDNVEKKPDLAYLIGTETVPNFLLQDTKTYLEERLGPEVLSKVEITYIDFD